MNNAQQKIFYGVLSIMLMSSTVFAQTDTQLEQRVQKLEEYVSTIQPTIVELSNNINDSMMEYTQGLEASLEGYSLNLQANLDERLSNINSRIVYLNPYSKAYQSLETNTGTFLISVEGNEAIENGVRLHLNVGNPNFADYQNFQLRLIWGQKWPGKSVIPYSEWRSSLQGADFSFEGRIQKGKWNTVTVDLIPANVDTLAHIECTMTVSSVELGFD